MKKLTRYILREHIAPFLFAFMAITFLLVIDYVPKIIDHVIDKDLSIWVALELVFFNLAWMLALSVPMSVLVAVLIAFGRLTSDFEITAIKSSGIHLMRVIAPLMVVGCVLMVGMIEFNDRILPDLNKRARLLWGDIAAMRPTLVFRSGVFISDIPGYLVLIDKVNHTTSRVEGVRITDTRNATKPQIVVAEYGFLESTDNGMNMQFTLHNGEIHKLDTEEPANYRRMAFDKHVLNVAGPGTELKRTAQDYRTDREMPIDQMQATVDRALATIGPFEEKITNQLGRRFDFLFSDSLAPPVDTTIDDIAAFERIQRQAANQYKVVQRSRQQIAAQTKLVNKFTIEIYKKYSIPAASLAFILIGAPLAVISRRGGMGVAIAISIGLFVLYWAFLIGGEDLADRGLVPPFWAMWSANFLLGGIGLFLIYKVVTEKPIFSYFHRADTGSDNEKD
ncbi:MAG: LptF/LptG family permease [candidate division Zixibacteria bacterium]|nr:LptF/LptG family permease [candidate division Zixibacteria bacterium]